MRYKMQICINEPLTKVAHQFSNFKEENNKDLALLYYESYRHSVDDEGESLEDWLAIVGDFKHGGFGQLLEMASFSYRLNNQLVAAIVIGLEDEMSPYIIRLYDKLGFTIIGK